MFQGILIGLLNTVATGTVSPPAGFNWTPPFSVYQVSKNLFATNINELALRVSTTRNIYVDVVTGSDANPGTAIGAPKKSIWSAINLSGNDTIYVKSGVYPTANSWAGVVPIQNTNVIAVKDFVTLEPGVVESVVGAGTINGFLNTNISIFVQGITFTGGLGRSFFISNGSATFVDCTFFNSESQDAAGITSNNAGITHNIYFIRCRAVGGFTDGFQYTVQGVGESVRFLELSCIATTNGKTGGTHQGSTAHKIVTNGPVTGIRINGTYINNFGPQNVADVGGVESWNLGITCAHTNGGGGNTAFYCGDNSKAWLHSCKLFGVVDIQTDNILGEVKVYDTAYRVVSGAGSVLSYTP